MQRRRCTVGCGPLITIYNILYKCLGVAIDCLVQHGPRLLLLSVGHAIGRHPSIHPSLTAKGICGSYILLGIAPSRRWRDPKLCRRFTKVTQGCAEGSSKMTKHRRVRRGPAPEGGALNRRDASGSAEAKDDEGEIP